MTSVTMELCRDRNGLFQADVFSLWTCSLCYAYLFREKGELVPNYHEKYPRLLSPNETAVYLPDVENKTATDQICDTLSDTNCQRWVTCCKAAISCCQRQISLLNQDSLGHYCPPTWDGFGCFDATRAGTKAIISCPSYIDQAVPTAIASKQCTEDATWWRDNVTNQEWTDYTTCVHLQGFKTLYYVGVSCNILSLALLLPACAVFVVYRQLRKQHRIKIHLNLFLSFVLTNIVMVLWEHIVYYNRLQTPDEVTYLRQDTIECKILYTVTRYSLTTNFLWMFLEGFHLHRLIVRAFKVPRSIIGYYIGGWAAPLIPVAVYAGIRVARGDEGCWVQNAGAFEWIIYVPNLFCIGANVFFLSNILKILLTQLQTHPNEPSSYRRALKATFVLIPLFGLQLFLIIFRPSTQNNWTKIYEMIAKCITNGQGAIVALLFCFFNGEVMTYLKACLPKCHYERERSDMVRSNSFTTQYIVDSTKTASRRKDTATKIEKKDYILLKTMDGKDPQCQHNGAV